MIDQGLKDERIARLAEDYLERKQRGESIDLSLFLRDYPDLAGEVADYIQLLEMMDGTRPNWSSRKAEKDRERIGDFRLIRLIGQGGMGLVFEAMQESLGRTVALKLMKQTSREPATIARFTREARAAARLHHTNIVAVYGVGIDQGEHYLALQYIKGISLDRLLQQLKVSHSGSTIKMKRTGSTVDGVAMPQSGNGSTAATSERDLSEKILHEWVQLRHTQPGRYFQRMSSLIADIADALEHAHSHGILHRDIKPSNLILDAEGVLWITDFGLARINEEENITQSGQLVGTLRYLAPERLKRRENHQSDQYSLAATLYELLTLQPVYDAPTSQELLLKISHQEPLPPTRHTPSLSMDLQTILLKALSRDPDHRYSRTSEFGNDLRRYVEGQPIRARRMGYASLAYRWAKRNPLVSGLIAAIFVTLITGLAVSTVFYLKADADRITAGESEQKANRAASEESKAKARSDKIKNFFIKEVLALAEPTKKGRNVTLLDALGDATARVPVIFARDPQLRAEVHTQLGELYREIGKTPSAIEQHQQALEIRQKLFGPESMEANRSIINIALSRMDEGKLQEAETTLTKMLPIFEKELGIDDAQTITIRDNLGVILEKLGKYSEAIPYQRYALEFARDRHGPNNDLTLNAQNNYGFLLVKAKRYDEAFAMLEDLISKLQQRFSPDHHRVLVARNNLMTMAFQRQQYRHAMTQAREILEAQQRKAGDSDPLTLMYMNNLGTILIHVDRKESQQVLLKAIALMEKHLSPNHPHRLSAYHNLGSCYNYDEEYELAEKYLLRALSGRREILPEKHPERLATLLYLGQAMQGQKKYEAAIQFFQEALTQQSKLQERDATMLLARRCCAQCYLETGKLKEAEALVLDNLRRVNDSATHGKDHQLNSELLAKLKVMRSTPTDSSGKQ